MGFLASIAHHASLLVLSHPLLKEVGLPLEGDQFHEVERVGCTVYLLANQLIQQAVGDKLDVLTHELGVHPDDQKPVDVCNGRYGPYVRHGKVNATLPKDITPEEVTLEEGLALLTARVAKGPVVKKSAAKKKPAAGEKPVAKKKPASKKSTATKKSPVTKKKPATKK